MALPHSSLMHLTTDILVRLIAWCGLMTILLCSSVACISHLIMASPSTLCVDEASKKLSAVANSALHVIGGVTDESSSDCGWTRFTIVGLALAVHVYTLNSVWKNSILGWHQDHPSNKTSSIKPLQLSDLRKALYPDLDSSSSSNANKTTTTTTTTAAHCTSCAICLEHFEVDEDLRCGHLCQHWFHTDCIDAWLQRDQHTCPYCRQGLKYATSSKNTK